jgi:hypothetical protein
MRRSFFRLLILAGVIYAPCSAQAIDVNFTTSASITVNLDPGAVIDGFRITNNTVDAHISYLIKAAFVRVAEGSTPYQDHDFVDAILFNISSPPGSSVDTRNAETYICPNQVLTGRCSPQPGQVLPLSPTLSLYQPQNLPTTVPPSGIKLNSPYYYITASGGGDATVRIQPVVLPGTPTPPALSSVIALLHCSRSLRRRCTVRDFKN